MSLLEKLFPLKKIYLSEEEGRQIAKNGTEKQRRAMASDERTSQDILDYMAVHDVSKTVREMVAANPSTPMQASLVLVKDVDKDVRLVIAHRLMKILPELSHDKYSQLYAFAVQSLGTLALDEVLKIRKALAETLKDHADTPPAVALQLARDLERDVSEPILRFCAAISDDDLIEILQTHPANWAAEAVASRKTLSTRVSEAVIDTRNIKAGAILLNNEGAEITPELLSTIVDRAREYPEWHKPLAARKNLPPLMARKLATFVDSRIQKILHERSDLDNHTIGQIRAVVARRTEYEGAREKSPDRENPVARAQKLYDRGEITEDLLSDALAMRDNDFVVACLATMLRASVNDVQKVFDVKAARGICAICWAAGFSMRLAFRLQQTLGQVKHSSLVYPRGGTDYPLTPEDMRMQLDVIGIRS